MVTCGQVLLFQVAFVLTSITVRIPITQLVGNTVKHTGAYAAFRHASDDTTPSFTSHNMINCTPKCAWIFAMVVVPICQVPSYDLAPTFAQRFIHSDLQLHFLEQSKTL
jgi:hypothetical protein